MGYFIHSFFRQRVSAVIDAIFRVIIEAEICVARKLWIKYTINIDVHFVGYFYIMDLINGRKMERSERLILSVCFLRFQGTLAVRIKTYRHNIFRRMVGTFLQKYIASRIRRWDLKTATFL